MSPQNNRYQYRNPGVIVRSRGEMVSIVSAPTAVPYTAVGHEANVASVPSTSHVATTQSPSLAPTHHHSAPTTESKQHSPVAKAVRRPTPTATPSIDGIHVRTVKPSMEAPASTHVHAAPQTTKSNVSARRQSVVSADDAKMVPSRHLAAHIATPENTQKKRGFRPRLVHAAASLIFFVGVGLMVQGFLLNHSVDTQVKALQSESTQDATASSTQQIPTSRPPEDKNYIQNYHVAAQLPRTITISQIGVYARVLQVGVDKNNTMLTPTTAYDSAWYNGSSRPGEQGAMVINGHVLGDGGPGIFGRLKELGKGSVITVESGDGHKYNYVVANVETVKVDQIDMGKLLVSNDTSKPGLNLITCGGKYDPAKNEFDSRTLVYAVLK